MKVKPRQGQIALLLISKELFLDMFLKSGEVHCRVESKLPEDTKILAITMPHNARNVSVLLESQSFPWVGWNEKATDLPADTITYWRIKDEDGADIALCKADKQLPDGSMYGSERSGQ